MYKRVSLLLASITTVAGLVVGVTPAHAATAKAQAPVTVFSGILFSGAAYSLESTNGECARISLFGPYVRSAQFSGGTLGSLVLYRNADGFFNLTCKDPVATLSPGTSDGGLSTELGRTGAGYYTLFYA